MPTVNGYMLDFIHSTETLKRAGYSPKREYQEGERGTFRPNSNHPGYGPDLISYNIGRTLAAGGQHIDDYKDGLEHKLAQAGNKVKATSQAVVREVREFQEQRAAHEDRFLSQFYPTQAERDYVRALNRTGATARQILTQQGFIQPCTIM